MEEEDENPSVRNRDDEKKTKRRSSTPKQYYYEHFDEETALALVRDDKEIEFLESNLGITKLKKKELNREYANNEGFGTDFGDFLMDLDNLVDRCVGGGGGGVDDDTDEDDSSGESLGNSNNDDDDSNVSIDVKRNKIESKDSDMESSYDNSEDNDDDLSIAEEDGVIDDDDDDDDYSYTNIDEETAIALRNDDAEILALEEKLGISSATNSSKARKKLRKEYASAFSGYGEDFADFLDELDTLGQKIGMRRGGRGGGREDTEALSSGNDDDDDDNSEDGSNNGSDDSDSESGDTTSDHDVALTYRPIAGEDIYGNTIDPTRNDSSKPSKYVPPHLRNRSSHQDDDDTNNATTTIAGAAAAEPEVMIQIQRQINNALNRLSDQTLESVSKSIASVYSTFAFRDVNDCLWKNIQISCIPSHMIMSGLIPLYIGAMAGVHWLAGDGSQIGGCLVEWSITNLFDLLIKIRKACDEDETNEVDDLDHDVINKEASNLILIVCYLYNYGVIHCTLIYDLVRDFIRNFMEIDVEGLLIILSHCGQQLRSDDPTALREIVLMVKDRAKSVEDSSDDITNIADSSRIQYMVDSITELKNNKPRKQDAVIREKANALKKIVVRIKNSTSQSLVGQKSGSCLRVTLQDVLDAESKGRWWMVGASWTGNQDRDLLWGTEDGPDQKNNEHSVTTETRKSNSSSSKNGSHDNEDSLLALASSQRMNTDTRRSIFCVVMGSTDCDDAFEKLVRGGMLKPKVERDVIRVLIHCCGEEKAYNPFYAYLATRCCEYQAKSRFTLMLTFWDAFKQFDTFSARKVANLAKLLAHFVSADNKYTNIGVLKRIDFSPMDMSEMAILFVTIFMTAIFESCDVESTKKIFAHDTTATDVSGTRKSKHVDSDSDDDDDDVDTAAKSGKTKKEDLSELKENLSIFLLQYLKSSPKNIEGSKFHSNLLAAIATCEKTTVNA
jgi:nucleolar MIF4G domain-containing protein 1